MRCQGRRNCTWYFCCVWRRSNVSKYHSPLFSASVMDNLTSSTDYFPVDQIRIWTAWEHSYTEYGALRSTTAPTHGSHQQKDRIGKKACFCNRTTLFFTSSKWPKQRFTNSINGKCCPIEYTLKSWSAQIVICFNLFWTLLVVYRAIMVRNWGLRWTNSLSPGQIILPKHRNIYQRMEEES